MVTKLFVLKLPSGARRLPNETLERLVTRALGFCPPVWRTDSGKPMLGDGEYGVSVSHSGGVAAVAVACGCVGVDMQKHRDAPYDGLAARFFHADEAALVAAQGAEAFFDIWTAKEAYVKYTGSGIDGGFSEFSAAADGGLADRIGECAVIHIKYRDGFSLCLCTGGETGYELAEENE